MALKEFCGNRAAFIWILHQSVPSFSCNKNLRNIARKRRLLKTQGRQLVRWRARPIFHWPSVRYRSQFAGQDFSPQNDGRV